MMAAERHFIYSRGGLVDENATHVTTDESVTVITSRLFQSHKNIVELICHAGVKRINIRAFGGCPRLRQLLIPGVEIVEEDVFNGCVAVTDIECPKLERVGNSAFARCKSLSNIDLSSAKFVEGFAFDNCIALKYAKFGKNLELIRWGAFANCLSLERITIPLKNGLFTEDNIFLKCANLKWVDLVEAAVLHETIAALQLEEWRSDLNAVIDSINHILPNARAGNNYHVGGKAVAIRGWIGRVLRKIIDYKAQHRLLLSEAMSVLQLNTALPNDIVMNNVMCFLELPSNTFEGEE